MNPTESIPIEGKFQQATGAAINAAGWLAGIATYQYDSPSYQLQPLGYARTQLEEALELTKELEATFQGMVPK